MLVTPCCGAPIGGRPFACVHEHREWQADERRHGLRGDRCYRTEAPRFRDLPRPAPEPEQARLGL